MRRRVALAGAVLLAITVHPPAFAPVVAPWVSARARRPGSPRPAGRAAHWLGTDDVGRDVLSRVLYGARISVVVGGLVVLLAVAAGLAVGLLAGYYRGLDNVLMRVMDGLMAFPAILRRSRSWRRSGRASGTWWWRSPSFTRRASRGSSGLCPRRPRAAVRQAARAAGAADLAILRRHVLPNCLSPVIVQGTFIFALAVLGEAALSFLGVGAPPTVPSWGNILAEGRLYLQQAPWLVLAPASPSWRRSSGSTCSATASGTPWTRSSGA